MERERDRIEFTGLEQRSAGCGASKCRGQAGGPGPSRDQAASDAGMAEACAGTCDQRVTGEDEIETAAGA